LHSPYDGGEERGRSGLYLVCTHVGCCVMSTNIRAEISGKRGRSRRYKERGRVKGEWGKMKEGEGLFLVTLRLCVSIARNRLLCRCACNTTVPSNNHSADNSVDPRIMEIVVCFSCPLSPLLSLHFQLTVLGGLVSHLSYFLD
jgi:hypothetical protein